MSAALTVDYQTHPSHYKHINLSFEGEIATLVLMIHRASHTQISTALAQLGALACVRKTPRMIRVEHFS